MSTRTEGLIQRAQVISDEILEQTQSLCDATMLHQNANQQTREAKQAYDTARSERILSGIEGKNEAERNAKLEFLLRNEARALTEAQEAEQKIHVTITLCGYHLRALRDSLECIKIIASLEVAK